MLLKHLLGFSGYVVLGMTLGPLWHYALFPGAYESFGIYNRTAPIVPLGFLSMLIQGAILVLLAPRWIDRAAPLRSGAVFGLLMGLFMFTTTALAAAAKTHVAGMGLFMLLQAGFHLIQFAATGAFLGWVFAGTKPVSDPATLAGAAGGND